MQPRHPLLTDFDGTLTTIAGGALVFTKPYHAVVTNDEIRSIIAANHDVFAKLTKEIDALEAEKDHVSSQISDLQFAEEPAVQPLANSDDYQPANLNASGEYTTLDLSSSGETNPEIQELNMQLATIENKISALNEQKKKYAGSPYIIMGEQNLNQEQIRTRSREILAKIKQQPNQDVFKLADGAKEFLLAALADSSMPVYIISKNHEEYIRAVLLFNGISEEQVNQITIYDARKGGGNKYSAADKILDGFPAGTVVISCDDDRNDSLHIIRAVKDHRMRGISRNQPAGQFNFPGILDEFTEASKKAAVKAKSSEKLFSGLRKSGIWNKRSSQDADQPEINSPSTLKKSRGGNIE